MIKLTASDTFIVAQEGESPRTISGVAVPWNTEATVSDGTRVMFERGSLAEAGKKPKLLKYHDDTAPVGIVTSRLDTEKGMLFTARISATSEGNDMLELIKDGAVDAVSVGVNPIDYRFNDDGVMVISRGDWVELSLVTAPAFRGATITEVAATEGKSDEQELQPMTDKIETAAAVAEVPAAAPSAPVWAAAKKEFKLPSAAEYISKVLRGGSESQQFFANIKAAAPDVVTTDTPGILPEPIVGPVYNNFRGLRPVVDAVGVKAMPGGGKVFRRPEVTTHTTIGASNGENQNLDSGTFVVSNNNVTKGVYGGYVRLSEEDMDWTEPEVLGLLLDDMARIYANETDNVAADNLVTGATTGGNFTSANYQDPAYWVERIYTAAGAILSNSNGNLPTHLFVSNNVWQALGQLSDTADRPLFPQVGPMNAFGAVSPGSTNATAFGLTVVVDRNFAVDTMIVGHPTGYEIFEQQKGAIQVEAADGSLSRYIKFRGYFATLMIDASKFYKFTWV
jgi:HK97 family phage prohead protease